VTRDGHPLGELIPLRRRRRFVARDEFAAMSRNAAVVDDDVFRTDQDAAADHDAVDLYEHQEPRARAPRHRHPVVGMPTATAGLEQGCARPAGCRPFLTGLQLIRTDTCGPPTTWRLVKMWFGAIVVAVFGWQQEMRLHGARGW
jgi:hypothetical protein